MTLDLVVARVAAALGRGHALFSPAPLDAAAGVSGSSATLTSLSNRIAASPQTLGASGQFADAYDVVAQQFSGHLSGTAALDGKLSGLVNEAASAEAAGRNESGNVVNAAADTARTGPFTNTPAGQRALLITLRDRVDEQRQIVAAIRPATPNWLRRCASWTTGMPPFPTNRHRPLSTGPQPRVGSVPQTAMSPRCARRTLTR